VTHPDATRYFMTIQEACGLVILTATITDGGGLFLLDMGAPIRIAHLAANMIRMRGLRVERDVPIAYTGLRPGERLHEVLVGPSEQLVPTTFSKINRVMNRAETPTLATIDQWLQTLQKTLTCRDRALVRARLFDMLREPAQI